MSIFWNLYFNFEKLKKEYSENLKHLLFRWKDLELHDKTRFMAINLQFSDLHILVSGIERGKEK